MAEQILTGEQVLGASEGPRDVAETQRGQISVCLLGASFDTGNLGVSALAESSILAIRRRWPEARVVLLASSREAGWHRLRLPDGAVDLQKVPVRFCKNVLLPCHYAVLFCYVLLVRLLPFERVKRYLAGRNATLRLLLDTRLFVDVTGGDSFSDIYGMRRFTMAFLVRMLPLMLKKDMVLFPQTYGPFKRAISRSMARFVLRRAKRVYSRDQAGLDVVNELLGRSMSQQALEFAPDVAFLLEPRKPGVLEVDGLDTVDDETSTLVGLNVSGLIYYGGYSGGNEFGLKVEYKELLDALVEQLLQQEDVRILLVPHVIPAGGYRGDTENDLAACLDVQQRLSQRYPGRLFVARGDYDQGEVKYVIGMCDFFIGTRMHSCVAALSQCIPAVGVAYSKKFKGVFATVGAEALVADMRSSDVDEILRIIGEAFAARRSMAARLRETVPEVKQRVSNLLEGLDL
jgi:polysaccharide pyruvyl transferase WcaK-like protein